MSFLLSYQFAKYHFNLVTKLVVTKMSLLLSYQIAKYHFNLVTKLVVTKIPLLLSYQIVVTKIVVTKLVVTKISLLLSYQNGRYQIAVTKMVVTKMTVTKMVVTKSLLPKILLSNQALNDPVRSMKGISKYLTVWGSLWERLWRRTSALSPLQFILDNSCIILKTFKRVTAVDVLIIYSHEINFTTGLIGLRKNLMWLL